MDIKQIIEKLDKMHPYKERGNPDSYSQYNEGWSDCLGVLGAELDKLTEQSAKNAHQGGKYYREVSPEKGTGLSLHEYRGDFTDPVYKATLEPCPPPQVLDTNLFVKILKTVLEGTDRFRVEFDNIEDHTSFVLDVCNEFKKQLLKHNQ